ncbi:hypothetical protein E2320_013655 [Naja naja]|nr:hypothetical protein E2320_013655 [Naja naja]
MFAWTGVLLPQPGLYPAISPFWTERGMLPVPFSGHAAEEPRPPASQRVILAVFLGGCTFSEVAALRFLGRERGLRFIILTTAITSSARLLESTMEMRM